MTPADLQTDDDVADGASWAEAVLNALPVGVAIYDADQVAILANPAYCASVGVPPGGVPPGMKLEDCVRQAAYRGVFGPGDPEAQVAAVLSADRSRPAAPREHRGRVRPIERAAEPLPGRQPFPALAWQAAGQIARAAAPTTASVVTTIDADLQRQIGRAHV